MDKTDDHSIMPGYIPVKEAAQILNISVERVRFYISKGRIPAVWAADVLMIKLEDVHNFRRRAAGRTRRIVPVWRLSTDENNQYMTSISVPVRAGQEGLLIEQLGKIKRGDKHLFPGTIARYVSMSGQEDEYLSIILVWRGTIMPDKAAREEALGDLRQDLADVLDWDSARYEHNRIVMHT